MTKEKKEKKKGGKLKWIIIAVVVLVIIGAAVGGGDGDKVQNVTANKAKSAETSASASSSSAKSESEKPAEKTEFAVGETAEYKGVQMSVLNYEESAGNDWGKPADGKVFVFANVEMTNNTDKEITISSMMSFDAYSDDYKLDFSSDALMAASTEDKQQLDGTIAPGKKLNGYLGLEVPAEWKSIEITYKDNVWIGSNFKFIINK